MQMHVCPVCKDKWIVSNMGRAETYIDHLEKHLSGEANA